MTSDSYSISRPAAAAVSSAASATCGASFIVMAPDSNKLHASHTSSNAALPSYSSGLKMKEHVPLAINW